MEALLLAEASQPEIEDVEQSPAERLAAFARGVLPRLRKFGGRRPTTRPPGIFWRELVITVGLLLIWQISSTSVPIPVLDWRVARDLGGGIGRSGAALSLGVLGLRPYLLAHAALFWVVMAFARLRRMDFHYRFALNRHVLGLTFLFSVLMGWPRLAWLAQVIGPDGRRAVLPFFWHHAFLYRAVGLSALTAGVGFTLCILWLIQRYGVPAPVTSMLLWEAFANPSLYRAPWSVLRTMSNNDVGARHQAAWALRMGLAFLLVAVLAYLILALLWRPVKAGLERVSPPEGIRALWSEEPQPYLFGTFSTSVAMGAVLFVPQAMVAVAEFSGANTSFAEHYFDWYQRHGLWINLVSLALVIPSAILAYRLLYNPSLRHRLGASLGLDESLEGLKRSTFRALMVWSGFVMVVIAIAWLKSLAPKFCDGLRFLGLVQLWDVVLLVFAAILLRGLYRRRREGLSASVMIHGYYEPLLAAQSALRGQGIRSQVWGEPYALLTGIIVGPIAMKRLLVSEADRDKAIELLSPRSPAAGAPEG